jgi:hypothetical protein
MPARRALAQNAACLAYETVVDDPVKETRRMVEFLYRGTAAIAHLRRLSDVSYRRIVWKNSIFRVDHNLNGHRWP